MRPGRTTAALVAAALLTAGGCARPSDPAAAAILPVSDQPRIGLTEWAIVTGQVAAASGDVTLVVTNTGGTAHDLAVHGRHGTWRTPVLGPGERAELAVRTAPGEHLHLECTLTGHHAQGMHAELPVQGLGR